jgi:hypothetical protein
VAGSSILAAGPGLPGLSALAGQHTFARMFRNPRRIRAGSEPCHAVAAARLRIYPPDQTSSSIVLFPLKAGKPKGVIYTGVWPVQQAQPPEGLAGPH